MMERTKEWQIDDPRTKEDFILAATAWATGKRSTTNYLADSTPAGAQRVEIADMLHSIALSNIAQAMES